MGVWEGVAPNGGNMCDVPDCANAAMTVFLPAFESPGGWSGDTHQYDPELDIAYVCADHRPGSSR